MWRLNSFDTGKIVFRSRIPVPSTQPQAGCHSDGKKKLWGPPPPPPPATDTHIHFRNGFSHPLPSAPNTAWCFPEGATNLENPKGMSSGLCHLGKGCSQKNSAEGWSAEILRWWPRLDFVQNCTLDSSCSLSSSRAPVQDSRLSASFWILAFSTAWLTLVAPSARLGMRKPREPKKTMK